MDVKYNCKTYYFMILDMHSFLNRNFVRNNVSKFVWIILPPIFCIWHFLHILSNGTYWIYLDSFSNLFLGDHTGSIDVTVKDALSNKTVDNALSNFTFTFLWRKFPADQKQLKNHKSKITNTIRYCLSSNRSQRRILT